MRISDWSSDVCSSDLVGGGVARGLARLDRTGHLDRAAEQQQLLGQGGLAGVRVRNDREGAAAGGFGGNVRHGESASWRDGDAGRMRIIRVAAARAGMVAPVLIKRTWRLVRGFAGPWSERAHVGIPVTNRHPVARLLLKKK